MTVAHFGVTPFVYSRGWESNFATPSILLIGFPCAMDDVYRQACACIRVRCYRRIYFEQSSLDENHSLWGVVLATPFVYSRGLEANSATGLFRSCLSIFHARLSRWPLHPSYLSSGSALLRLKSFTVRHRVPLEIPYCSSTSGFLSRTNFTQNALLKDIPCSA